MTQFEEDVATEPAAIADSTDRAMEFLQNAGVDARAVHHVALVLEEILTNIATHGGRPAEPTKVRITVEPKRVAGEIFDSGSPYDPRTGPTPDLEATLEDRRIGGLGLHLVKQLTSELDYERRGERNRTVFAIARAG
jgi:anti-sigma regulatory factor (Ser/Thr protein kinase)